METLTSPSQSNFDSGLSCVEALLPRKLMEMLTACPRRPQKGVHNWLIRVAVRLHHHIADRDCIAELLRKHSADCGRDVEEHEIWNAVEDSAAWLAAQEGRPTAARSKPKPSAVAREQIDRIIKSGPTLAELSTKSPVSWTDGKPHSEEVVSKLFPPGSLVCVGQSQSKFKTAPLEALLRFKTLRLMSFIVPSPMAATIGRTKRGKLSAHTLDNTGPRRFHIVEFDEGTADEQAALLWHLGEREPLVLVVHSGGRSLHGWFLVQGRDEHSVMEFMDYAEGLGADSATRTKSQFVRMPDGRRDNGKRQRILYFNPQLLEAK